ncbi:MAG: hypothetical protein QGF90_17060 [Gammaproteobacteria bacterium]|jgi:hypothetical protein|nr:hypothetical protein [Gammaproteobacteria bacterium]
MLASICYLPPYVVPDIPDLLLMDEPARFARGQRLIPEGKAVTG